MDWKTKSRVIGAVERMPFSGSVYYLLQRYLTRSIPRPATSIEQVRGHEARHLAAFRRNTGRELPSATYEFGAGWDLCSAIVRRGLGVTQQDMVDLHRLASAWQINHVIDYLRLHDVDIPHRVESLTQDLDRLGIHYRAPFDARATSMKDECVDYIVSTNTLEHIPPADLALIFRECRRILSSDGIMSMKIDYSDHYSHADGSISPYNFLAFSDAEWARHDHENHYQNRLRHREFRDLFLDAGLTILEESSALPPEPRSGLPKLAARFENFTRDELLPTEGTFVLRK